MRVRIRHMEAQDADQCAALLASYPEEQRRYGTLLKRLPSAWRKLLRAGSMISAFVEDIDFGSPRLVACGASVFVTDEFLRWLKTAPFVWIGPELLRRSVSGDSHILSAKHIREANSWEGLNLVVWEGVTWAPRPEDQSVRSVELLRAFVDYHQGYRIEGVDCPAVGVRTDPHGS